MTRRPQLRCAVRPVAESDVAQEFDLSSLPKLEDMTATTDITPFSARVSPNICANAALRKILALDPRSQLLICAR